MTLGQAASLITTLADSHSLLLLSAPGVGKSAIVAQTAAAAGLELRSLLGTQIAPEDVSGVPQIVGERSVFCPPRMLLPENPEPFCLFLDELPATAPDVQKSFYSLLNERRVGEFRLPDRTWVVGAGNRVEDRALVRAMSSALVNRVIILNIAVDVAEWVRWARRSGIRSDVIAFVLFDPSVLMRPVPAEPVPFSTPRAWAGLAHALDRVEAAGELTPQIRRALAFGSVTAQDAATYCALADHLTVERDIVRYLGGSAPLPADAASRWMVVHSVRLHLSSGRLVPGDRTGYLDGPGGPISITAPDATRFFTALGNEERMALLIDLVEDWGRLGIGDVLLGTLRSFLEAAPS